MPNPPKPTLRGPDLVDAVARAIAYDLPGTAAQLRIAATQWRRDLVNLDPREMRAAPAAATGRDPRTFPLPGDRLHLPVVVSDVGYGRGGFDIELHAIVDGVAAFDVTVLHDHSGKQSDGVGRWLRGAVDVVAAADPVLVARLPVA